MLLLGQKYERPITTIGGWLREMVSASIVGCLCHVFRAPVSFTMSGGNLSPTSESHLQALPTVVRLLLSTPLSLISVLTNY